MVCDASFPLFHCIWSRKLIALRVHSSYYSSAGFELWPWFVLFMKDLYCVVRLFLLWQSVLVRMTRWRVGSTFRPIGKPNQWLVRHNQKFRMCKLTNSTQYLESGANTNIANSDSTSLMSRNCQIVLKLSRASFSSILNREYVCVCVCAYIQANFCLSKQIYILLTSFSFNFLQPSGQ